jgi:hypothetical protein
MRHSGPRQRRFASLITGWLYAGKLQCRDSMAGPATWVLSCREAATSNPHGVHSLQFAALSAARLSLAGLDIFVAQIGGIHITEHLESLRSGSTTVAGSIRRH